jgi:hypothetical protein
MIPKLRTLLFGCLVLALSQQAARADTVDNFTLVGDGHTVTWSLPGAASFPDFSLFNFFYESAPATIDGISGYSIGGDYYTYFYRSLSVEFDLPASIFGASSFPLAGPQFTNISFVAAYNPPPYLQEDVIGGFNPGTYSLQQLSAGPPVDFTLTIAQQTLPDTPEPPSLLLLATGALGFAWLFARQVHRAFALHPSPTCPTSKARRGSASPDLSSSNRSPFA